MVPRKFFAMLNVALEYNEAKYSSDWKKKNKKDNKVVDGYIDNIKW